MGLFWWLLSLVPGMDQYLAVYLAAEPKVALALQAIATVCLFGGCAALAFVLWVVRETKGKPPLGS